MSSPLDTAGFLTRDAKEFAEFGKAWYGSHFQSFGQAMPKVGNQFTWFEIVLR
jgi:hypothetical protein